MMMQSVPERIVSNEIVDSVRTSATIFQLVDDKLLRISTTVKKTDGKRATGTAIAKTQRAGFKI
jgi:hypothetical protein